MLLLLLAAAPVIVDTHADTTFYLVEEKLDLLKPARKDVHLDIAKAKAGGLSAEFFSIFVDARYSGTYAHRALAQIDAVLEQVRAHPGELQLAVTADQVLAAQKAGKLAVLMGLEGGHMIENDLRLLRTFHRLGVRYMTLTHASTNEWADSSGDTGKHDGLSPFGEDVVREMNRLGMMVDVSHVADATLSDVLALTQVPVIASHSSARALCDAPRNLTDDQLRAIAKNGGVVQVNFFPGFIDPAWLAAWKKQAPERKAAEKAAASEMAEWEVTRKFAAKLGRPPLKLLIDHLDHIAKVAGVEHVGLGSDFDGIPALPAGLDSAADLPKITAGLKARGYPDEQLALILGGNTLRLMRAVEQAAAH